MTDLCALYVLFVLPALIFGLLPASFVLERVRFRLADARAVVALDDSWRFSTDATGEAVDKTLRFVRVVKAASGSLVGGIAAVTRRKALWVALASQLDEPVGLADFYPGQAVAGEQA